MDEGGLAGRTDTLNPDVTDGGSSDDATVYTIKQGCFPYADMLHVVVFMFILYSKVKNIPSLRKNQHLIYIAQFGQSVCFNPSETAGGTSNKLSTIDHHPVVSVVRVFVITYKVRIKAVSIFSQYMSFYHPNSKDCWTK